MALEQKAFINSLLEHYQPQYAQNVHEMLKDLLGEKLQGMPETEIGYHLDYSKYDYKNKKQMIVGTVTVLKW